MELMFLNFIQIISDNRCWILSLALCVSLVILVSELRFIGQSMRDD